jgi:16S rRNA (cytidine1402-2'-O)-methyltransferase
MFAGFLPSKPSARTRTLEALKAVEATLIFFEAPTRLAASLAALRDSFGGTRRAAVLRELTKLFEECRDGEIAALAQHYEASAAPKGEIVIVVAPPDAASPPDASDLDALLDDALACMSLRDAVAAVAAASGASRSELYRRALARRAAR